MDKNDVTNQRNSFHYENVIVLSRMLHSYLPPVFSFTSETEDCFLSLNSRILTIMHFF